MESKIRFTLPLKVNQQAAYWSKESKGLLHYALIHLRFLFFSRFSRVFDTNMLVSKTRVKTREKCERKIKNASPTRDNVSILHYAMGKNVSQLRFSRVLLAFFSRFCSQTQTKSIV